MHQFLHNIAKKEKMDAPIFQHLLAVVDLCCWCCIYSIKYLWCELTNFQFKQSFKFISLKYPIFTGNLIRVRVWTSIFPSFLTPFYRKNEAKTYKISAKKKGTAKKKIMTSECCGQHPLANQNIQYRGKLIQHKMNQIPCALCP